MNQKEIAKLVTFIEENLRASTKSGLSFVDARLYQKRLMSKQNHVVFGRRGAGKTSLVTSVMHLDDHIHVYLNLEDYKDITFPNIVIHVLIELFDGLREKIDATYPNYKFWNTHVAKLRKELIGAIKELKDYLLEPDLDLQEVSTKEASEKGVSFAPNIAGVGASGNAKLNRSLETKRAIQRDKIDFLRLELSKYKKLLVSISSLLNDRPIFLIMDDFYFVNKAIQPDLVDYFHRLTKDTNLYIKLATIKHRSKLYRRTDNGYIGLEIGHDIFDIDMDYTLNDFEDLKNFMSQLLTNAVERSGAKIEIDDIFAGTGFPELCLASGGVPRDFLFLFVTLANDAASTEQKIGKTAVIEAAINNVTSKYESMKRDSGDDDLQLERVLFNIKNYVYHTKKTNAFLIAKPDLDVYAEGRQALGELVDLRLIHLIESNTSKAPSDGRRYEAYMIDIGLYDNSRPVNFNQIEPGLRDDKSRMDELRASPVVELTTLFIDPPDGARIFLSSKPLVKKEYKQLPLELSFE